MDPMMFVSPAADRGGLSPFLIGRFTTLGAPTPAARFARFAGGLVTSEVSCCLSMPV